MKKTNERKNLRSLDRDKALSLSGEFVTISPDFGASIGGRVGVVTEIVRYDDPNVGFFSQDVRFKIKFVDTPYQFATMIGIDHLSYLTKTKKSEVLEYMVDVESKSRKITLDLDNKLSLPEILGAYRQAWNACEIISYVEKHGISESHNLVLNRPSHLLDIGGDVLRPKTGLYLIESYYRSSGDEGISGIQPADQVALVQDLSGGPKLREIVLSDLLLNVAPMGFGSISSFFEHNQEKYVLSSYSVLELPFAEFTRDKFSIDLLSCLTKFPIRQLYGDIITLELNK